MKKWLLTAALFGGSLFAGQKQEKVVLGPKEPYIEKNIREVSQGSFIKAITQGKSMGDMQEHLIIKFSKGDSFPLALELGGSLVCLEQKEESFYSLVVQRDFYVCVPRENEVFFSLDKKTWQPFLEFITGNLSVYTNFNDQVNELTTEISLILDKR